MLFDVTFSDGSVRTLQAHNKAQLEMALKKVKFIKPAVRKKEQRKRKGSSDVAF